MKGNGIEGNIVIDGESEKVITLIKTSNETIANDAILSLDADLQTTLKGNHRYYFEAFLDYKAEPTPDLKIAWNTPSGGDLNWQVSQGMGNGLQRKIYNDVHSYDGITATRMQANPCGLIDVNTNQGLFGLKWSQNVSDAGSVILYKGSCIIITDFGVLA